MQALQPVVQSIASIVNQIYALITKQSSALTVLWNLIAPFKSLSDVDWKGVEQALKVLSDGDRRSLEGFFISSLNVPQDFKDKITSVDGSLEKLVDVVKVEIVEVESVLQIINDVRKVLGV